MFIKEQYRHPGQDLGDQTSITVSHGFVKTSITNTICEKLFLLSESARLEVAGSSTNSSSTFVFVIRHVVLYCNFVRPIPSRRNLHLFQNNKVLYRTFYALQLNTLRGTRCKEVILTNDIGNRCLSEARRAGYHGLITDRHWLLRHQTSCSCNSNALATGPTETAFLQLAPQPLPFFQ